MTTKSFRLDIDADGIALVTIDLPDQSMNVWNEALMTEFAAFVEKFCTDDAIKGAVITSGKASGFLAGADLKMLGGGGLKAMQAASEKDRFEAVFALNRMLRKLETSGKTAKALQNGEAYAKPVAAAVNGLALGGADRQ